MLRGIFQTVLNFLLHCRYHESDFEAEHIICGEQNCAKLRLIITTCDERQATTCLKFGMMIT